MLLSLVIGLTDQTQLSNSFISMIPPEAVAGVEKKNLWTILIQ